MIRLNTGPSPRGWSRLESFQRCPTLYWWKHSGGMNEKTPALVRGSIGHAALGHFYARIQAQQQDRDPREIMSPVAAMHETAKEFGEIGAREVGGVDRILQKYIRYYDDMFPIVKVEEVHEIQFHGYRYTARADLVAELHRTSAVWIIDHKFVGRVEDKVFKRYALSGQFLGLHHLGAHHYGPRFGGVLLNVVGVNDGRLVRREIEPAPWALKRFPDVVAETERQIAILEGERLERWPMALSEVVCITPYGPCPCFERCRWGPKDGMAW